MLTWTATDGWQFSWLAAAVLSALILYQLRKAPLKRRRRNSLRRGADGVYIWIELDGSTLTSTVDPTPSWDANDAADSDSGDGDGGGD